jgi:hypothetical protein
VVVAMAISMAINRTPTKNNTRCQRSSDVHLHLATACMPKPRGSNTTRHSRRDLAAKRFWH